MKILKIYTDGACSGNQSENNIGGWGSVLEYGEHQKELYGGQVNTTNNRMEMMALIEALNAVKKDNQTIEVFSDSSYLMNCFREKWYEGWLKNNWVNSSKKPVENRDLWERLLFLIEGHNISFYRVKGHVNLNSKTTNFNALYEKFIQMNGAGFSFEDFKYITEMNNKVDALANKGIDQIRESL
ncbi:ribonuclease H family protein [Aminipila sp.]|uniref:ribonuclease H family protein n=1 Tax=Aminipila sp. TaxID=2060095 RepID=UPI00289FF6FD|nr:ribonuclease H [Aminipila sp.]